jgi:hypothetical protein
MKKPQKGAGRKASGNITVDLGEAIDKKLRSAIGEARKDVGPAKMAGYRPGMFGGYRPGGGSSLSRFSSRSSFGRPSLGSGGSFKPWYADRESRFSKLGLGALGVQNEVKTWDMLTGAAIGVIGNRALVRVSPDIIKKDSALLHNAIAFVVGVIPALVKQNSITLGVALPGAVFLAGSMVDWALDAIGINRPALKGSEGAPRQGVDAALAARQRLVEIQQRIAPRPAVAAAPARSYAQAR